MHTYLWVTCTCLPRFCWQQEAFVFIITHYEFLRVNLKPRIWQFDYVKPKSCVSLAHYVFWNFYLYCSPNVYPYLHLKFLVVPVIMNVKSWFWHGISNIRTGSVSSCSLEYVPGLRNTQILHHPYIKESICVWI